MWWRGTSTSPDHCSLSGNTDWENSSLRFMSPVRDAYPLVACNRLSQDMSRELGLFVDGLNQEVEPRVERLRVRTGWAIPSSRRTLIASFLGQVICVRGVEAKWYLLVWLHTRGTWSLRVRDGAPWRVLWSSDSM